MSPQPVQSGHDAATDDEKIDGIVEQMRGDISVGAAVDVAEVLQQRLTDAGLEISKTRFDKILAAL